ncbi:pitrilysin family protein [soil metagenome]
MNAFRTMTMGALLALGLCNAHAVSAKTADAAPVVDGDVTAATINGMTILVKRVPGAELVASNLYIRGGSRNWGKADAGVESLALRVAATGGTQSLDKVAFGQKLATLGSSIDAGTGRDWSSLKAKGLLGNFDSTFGLLADVFLHPALPAAEVELARSQALINLKREDEQPDSRLAIVVNETLYKGQPYENRPQGTLASVAALTPAQLQAHLAKLRQGSRLLLVVVGDIDAARVIAQAREKFGALPRGDYSDTPLPAPKFTKPRLVAEARTLPTTYMQGWFTMPAAGAPDYAAARVAMNHMWDQLFQEVRTKRNLSYAPAAGASVNQAGGMGMVGVTAVDPATTWQVIVDQLRLLQSTPLSPAVLAGSKATFLTNFLAASETTDGQADLLANWQLLAGDWKLSRSFMEQVRAVSAEDVQKFANTYMHNLQTVTLGNAHGLDEKQGTAL